MMFGGSLTKLDRLPHSFIQEVVKYWYVNLYETKNIHMPNSNLVVVAEFIRGFL